MILEIEDKHNCNDMYWMCARASKLLVPCWWQKYQLIHLEHFVI